MNAGKYNLIDKLRGKKFSIGDDWKETKDDLLSGAEDTAGFIGCGIGYGAMYALGPWFFAGLSGARALKDHGHKRDKAEWVTPKTFREKLNRNIKDYSNNLTPRLKQNMNYGLGDLLTEEVNFRRAGAVTGALALPIGMYSSFSDHGANPIKGVLGTAAHMAIMGPFSLLFAGIGSGVGYFVGNKIDSLLGQGAKEDIRSPPTYIAENMGA